MTRPTNEQMLEAIRTRPALRDVEAMYVEWIAILIKENEAAHEAHKRTREALRALRDAAKLYYDSAQNIYDDEAVELALAAAEAALKEAD